MSTQLAYDYASTARIMDAGGYTRAEIETFLIQHQNPSGYIRRSDIPKPRKPRKL